MARREEEDRIKRENDAKRADLEAAKLSESTAKRWQQIAEYRYRCVPQYRGAKPRLKRLTVTYPHHCGERLFPIPKPLKPESVGFFDTEIGKR